VIAAHLGCLLIQFIVLQLCLEGDGPEAGLELDEDEAFLELSRQAGHSGQQLNLILLPDSTDWTPRSSKPPTATGMSHSICLWVC